MRVKSFNVYQFDELSENARDKALEKMRDINVDNDQWCEFTLEYWKEELAKLGFDDAEIAYSGFWSQGDGASFTASINARQYIKAHKLSKKFKSLLNIMDRGWAVIGRVYRIETHYSHEYTVSVELETDYNTENTTRFNRVDSQVNELEPMVLQEVRDLSRKIYRELEKEFEYLTSDDAVIETIKMNEYEFDEYGILQ